MTKGKPLDSLLFGWPILRVASIGMAIQLVAFFILAALANTCPVRIAVIAEVLLLACEFVGLLFKDTAENVVRNTERASYDNTAAMKRLHAQAAALVKSNTDPALRASLEKLYDALRYADPVSGEATAEMEARIAEKLSSIANDEDVKEALRLINQRAELCKANKGGKL